jgi:hypothetical protein
LHRIASLKSKRMHTGFLQLTRENVILDLLRLYKENPRENIEKAIRRERPLVKRFVSQAYDGEYGEIPLRVAGIIAEYIEESV